MNSTNHPVPIAGTVGRLVPGEVQSVDFPRAPLGRRGLDEDHVRAFLRQVEMELTQILNERAGLADEVARLRRHVAAGSAAELPPEDAHIQAVRILAQAQQTADAYVADAERYSRELAGEARRHRQEILADANSRAELILREAHEKAAIAADDAARSVPAAASGSAGERRDMEREIAYLRTYSDVYRRHLRAYLEALLRNVDEWEQSERRSLPQPSVPDPAAHPQLPS